MQAIIISAKPIVSSTQCTIADGEGETTVTATLNGPNGICESSSIHITVIEGIDGGVANKVWPGWHLNNRLPSKIGSLLCYYFGTLLELIW